jgi:cob(I)alamin adenosyltransferase
MSAIAMKDLTIRYGPVEVVHGVTTEVGPGEWVALVGPNGSGKTSILRALSGLIPWTGDIAIGGRSATSLPGRELAKQLALVPQQSSAPLGMHVSTYALLGRTPHISYLSHETARDREIVHDVLAWLGIDHLADREVASLSGGERQLLVLARALAQQPSVLLLDEPTSALDMGRQQEILELIDGLRRDRGIAVLSAMHDLTHAGQYAGTVLFLSGGRLVTAGTPSEVLTEDRIHQHYRATVTVSPVRGDGISVVPMRVANESVPTNIGARHAIPNRNPSSEPPTAGPSPAQQPRVASVLIVNTGEGKGKSTAAFGVVMRAMARGWNVSVIQFIKSGKWKTGEEAVCRMLGVDWWTLGDGFSWDSDDLDRSEAIAREAWASAADKIRAGEHQLIVLDELTYAMNWGWVSSTEVLETLRERPKTVNVVVTGRDASDGLIEIADTVTNMVKIRHAYERGIAGRRGIEF